MFSVFLFQAEDGIRDLVRSRGLGDVYKRQPDKLNSFNREMALETIDALDVCKEDATIRAILLTGEGRAFCAGQDLSLIHI